jgi:hypothetical protein
MNITSRVAEAQENIPNSLGKHTIPGGHREGILIEGLLHFLQKGVTNVQSFANFFALFFKVPLNFCALFLKVHFCAEF